MVFGNFVSGEILDSCKYEFSRKNGLAFNTQKNETNK